MRLPPSGSHVPDDVECFVVCGRLKIGRDRLEFRVGRPRSAGGQVSRSILELMLAHRVRRVDEMQLVLDVRALEYVAEPGTLRPRVAWKVEHDRHAPR